MGSLGQATSVLNGALTPYLESLPTIEARRSFLTNLTREGRSEAEKLHRKAKTSLYQVERLEETTEMLKSTLEGYKKRMDDVDRAVEGIYTITPYADPDEPEIGSKGGEMEKVKHLNQASQMATISLQKEREILMPPDKTRWNIFGWF